MKTIFLGVEEVTGYARDIVKRLARGHGQADAGWAAMPKLWFCLGVSGDRLAQEMAQHVLSIYGREAVEELLFIRLNYDRKRGIIELRDPMPEVACQKVLLIDSAVHSGRSMMRAVELLERTGITQLVTYSMVLKKSSVFIPSYFGVLIDDVDRALFQLQEIPNNRLDAKRNTGYLRAVQEVDIGLTLPPVDVESMGSMTVGDLLYDARVHGSNVYFYMHEAQVAGYISFAFEAHRLFIDLVASSETLRRQGMKGIGSALMRWAETWARVSKCEAIELYAIENQREFYRHMGFDDVGLAPLQLSKAETYHLMRRKLLYNTKLFEAAG